MRCVTRERERERERETPGVDEEEERQRDGLNVKKTMRDVNQGIKY
jgi:hypothetical protein